ncbi:MAG: hypothetical protein ACK4TA_08810, partial [Saprospiraceae bacterium]
MIVVVDSGATKADWKVVDGTESQIIHSMGLSPVFHTEDFMYQEISKAFAGKIPTQKVEHVYYYGTGCWDGGRKGIVELALRRVFANAEILVEHDLLGAARAACGREPGIACILGTGSNSCLFDGENITDNVTNLGYMLGDEGSGVALGKMLIKAYFYREMPRDLMPAFEIFHPGGRPAILDKVYGKETPNVYLASFMPFYAQHRDHFFIQMLLHDAFAEFIDRHARKYSGHLSIPVNFVGSVAFHFQNILRIVLEERAMRPGN